MLTDKLGHISEYAKSVIMQNMQHFLEVFDDSDLDL